MEPLIILANRVVAALRAASSSFSAEDDLAAPPLEYFIKRPVMKGLASRRAIASSCSFWRIAISSFRGENKLLISI